MPKLGPLAPPFACAVGVRVGGNMWLLRAIGPAHLCRGAVFLREFVECRWDESRLWKCPVGNRVLALDGENHGRRRVFGQDVIGPGVGEPGRKAMRSLPLE